MDQPTQESRGGCGRDHESLLETDILAKPEAVRSALMASVEIFRRAEVDDLGRAEVVFEAWRRRNLRKKRQSNGAAMISGSLRAVPPLV